MRETLVDKFWEDLNYIARLRTGSNSVTPDTVENVYIEQLTTSPGELRTALLLFYTMGAGSVTESPRFSMPATQEAAKQGDEDGR